MNKGKKVLIAIAVIATAGLIACIGVDKYEKSQLKKLEQLQDTRLFSYEAEIENVREVAKIYSIHDDESYQDAKESIKMTSYMEQALFPTEKYTGSETEEPSVSIVDIQYVYEPDSEVQTFVVWLTKEVNGEVRDFDVICKYHQGYLIDLQGY